MGIFTVLAFKTASEIFKNILTTLAISAAVEIVKDIMKDKDDD